ncbi:uncharacterized protein LOC132720696 [Ruditapes philippinarum]|uniref:uncharacterized protein LOC132720696 n=1 Tax=Ruditapes philippinarum TaxID=129788 RepID=UPI00295A6467|nr:uncharacterized protein LOC132720696 [Ruditapes philippinarum]
MVQTLDLDSAEAEQQDLFYLVGCVLDEIEQAKAQKLLQLSPDGELDSIMPSADIEEHSDLMEQIESALSPFDDGISTYHSFFDASFMPERSFQTHQIPSEAQHTQSIADDLVEQIDMDNEYLSFVAKENKEESSQYSSASTNSSSTPYDVPERDFIVPEDIVQSAISLQNIVKDNNCDSVNKCMDVVNTQIRVNEKLNTDTSKDYIKHFDELKQYSDLIQLPDMTSKFMSQSSTSLQKDSVTYSHSQHQNLIQTHNFYEEDSNDTTSSELMSWTIKHPENWNATEVLDWLYYSPGKKMGPTFTTLGKLLGAVFRKKFSFSNGSRRFLKTLWSIFWRNSLQNVFPQLVKGLIFPLPAHSSFSEQSEFDQTYSYTESRNSSFSIATSPSELSHSHVTSPSQSSTQTSPDMYVPGTERLTPYDFVYANGNGSQSFQTSDTGNMLPPQSSYSLGMQPLNYPYEYTGSQYHLSQKSQYKMTARERYDTNGTPRRRPGRPRIKSVPTEEELQAQREKKMKSQHLWEFIYDMLNNPLYNPSILKWENQNEGVFRFVQSESVAQLWGTLKSNENMTYEKLSRAMRHYYKRGILERVEGRRLVYKFSMATLERMRTRKPLNPEIRS